MRKLMKCLLLIYCLLIQYLVALSQFNIEKAKIEYRDGKFIVDSVRKVVNRNDSTFLSLFVITGDGNYFLKNEGRVANFSSAGKFINFEDEYGYNTSSSNYYYTSVLTKHYDEGGPRVKLMPTFPETVAPDETDAHAEASTSVVDRFQYIPDSAIYAFAWPGDLVSDAHGVNDLVTGVISINKKHLSDPLYNYQLGLYYQSEYVTISNLRTRNVVGFMNESVEEPNALYSSCIRITSDILNLTSDSIVNVFYDIRPKPNITSIQLNTNIDFRIMLVGKLNTYSQKFNAPYLSSHDPNRLILMSYCPLKQGDKFTAKFRGEIQNTGSSDENSASVTLSYDDSVFDDLVIDSVNVGGVKVRDYNTSQSGSGSYKTTIIYLGKHNISGTHSRSLSDPATKAFIDFSLKSKFSLSSPPELNIRNIHTMEVSGQVSFRDGIVRFKPIVMNSQKMINYCAKKPSSTGTPRARTK